jgi:hypothetical protein
MSLKVAAQHLSAKGRGPDDTLVHMSRNEVKSLNDLAMAQGGQLTINPETGLPEAGFLSAMLPMLAGMALAPATGGASLGITSAWQTAALVGAGAYALNPKGGLMGGLKAGLGAYGGAGLGEALAQQGMQQAAGEVAAKEAAKNVAESNASNVMARTVDPTALTNAGVPSANISGMSTPLDMGPGSTQVLSPLQYGSTMTPEQLAAYKPTDFAGRMSNLGSGISSAVTSPGGASNLVTNMGGGFRAATTAASALSPALLQEKAAPGAPVVDKDLGQRYTYSPGVAKPLPAADVPTYEDMLTKQGNFGKQQNYYPNQGYTKVSSDEAKNIYGFAGGGPVEQMSNNNAIGANTGFPQAYDHTHAYATPYQTPISQNVLTGPGDTAVDPYTGEQRMAEGGVAKYGFGGFLGDAVSNIGSAIGHIGKSDNGGDPEGWAHLLETMGGKPKQQAMETAGYQYNPQTQQYQQMATGGISDAGYNLGGYSDGGRLLRGPGDGVSDSIPAVIGKKQPARLADGEFVVPARIVSEIGNGSTEAGARKLYGMMERVQAARGQTVGKGKVARNTRADKYLPA